MCDVQFTSHAIERVMGRLSRVTAYAEVQRAVSNSPVTNCHKRIVVKRLGGTVTIADNTAVNGQVKGNTVYAHVTPVNGGWRVDTVCLDF